MPYRSLDKSLVMRGRLQRLKIDATGSEVYAVDDIRDGVIDITEEIIREEYQLEDTQTISEIAGRKVIVNLQLSEFDSDTINQIRDADYILVSTTSGGTGSGRQFEISGSIDFFNAKATETKMEIIVEKTEDGNVLPYTATNV